MTAVLQAGLRVSGRTLVGVAMPLAIGPYAHGLCWRCSTSGEALSIKLLVRYKKGTSKSYIELKAPA